MRSCEVAIIWPDLIPWLGELVHKPIIHVYEGNKNSSCHIFHGTFSRTVYFPNRIHVWYIYIHLHLVDFYGTCRYILYIPYMDPTRVWIFDFNIPPSDHPEKHVAINKNGAFFRDPWVFPKIGGFYPPKWMVKIMENPIKMDDLEGPPIFLETPPLNSVFTPVLAKNSAFQSSTWRKLKKVGTCRYLKKLLGNCQENPKGGCPWKLVTG